MFIAGQKVTVSCAAVPAPVPDVPERATLFEGYGPRADECTVIRLKDDEPVGTPRERYLVKLADVEATE